MNIKSVTMMVIVLVTALLQGCAVVPASGRYPVGGYYPPYGGTQSGGYSHRSSVTTEPCQPYRADALMDWASGAGDNEQHSRSANVTVQNGDVNCRQSESASSSSSNKSRRTEAPPPREQKPAPQKQGTRS